MGEVLGLGREVRGLRSVRLRTRLAGAGRVGRVYDFRKCRLIPPHQSPTAPASPRGEAFLQESFRTTRQGDKREHLCPPSSVACGSKLLAVFFSPSKGKAMVRDSLIRSCFLKNIF